MFDQTLIDALVVLGLFVLRVGVPVAILFALATWVERKLRVQENQSTEQRTSSARIIPFAKPQKNIATAHTNEEIVAKQASVK